MLRWILKSSGPSDVADDKRTLQQSYWYVAGWSVHCREGRWRHARHWRAWLCPSRHVDWVLCSQDVWAWLESRTKLSWPSTDLAGVASQSTRNGPRRHSAPCLIAHSTDSIVTGAPETSDANWNRRARKRLRCEENGKRNVQKRQINWGEVYLNGSGEVYLNGRGQQYRKNV